MKENQGQFLPLVTDTKERKILCFNGPKVMIFNNLKDAIWMTGHTGKQYAPQKNEALYQIQHDKLFKSRKEQIKLEGWKIKRMYVSTTDRKTNDI